MKFRQRSSVLLPEPLAPRMAMRSPGITSRSMPLSTSSLAEALAQTAHAVVIRWHVVMRPVVSGPVTRRSSA
jgi:hypothetical protein